MMRRWSALLWLGPLLGLLTGLILVFGLLKANKSTRNNYDAGFIPACVDWDPYLTNLQAELASESTLIAVQRQLDRDRSLFKTPRWFLRRRTNRISSNSSEGREWGRGEINVTFIHHSEEGCERLADAFQAVAMDVVPRVRGNYTEGWLEQIDERLAEIAEIVRAAESEREVFFRSDVPLIDESEQLEQDREVLLLDEPWLGHEIALPGSFAGVPPWWKEPPEWALLVAKCAGYGLLAVLPAVFVLEALRPRRSPRQGVPADGE